MKKFEIKNQNEKHAQIEGLILNMTCFGAKIHLNETTCFGKNSTVSCTVHKFFFGNGALLNDTHVFFFPWTCEAGEEEQDFFLCSTASSLSKRCRLPTCLPHGGRMEGTYSLGGSGRQHNGHPNHVSFPCFCL